MRSTLTRREFLKIAGFSATALAFSYPPPGIDRSSYGLGRVTVDFIYLYQEPSFRSKKIDRLDRDTLLTLLERITPDEGPLYNPLWYRVPHGYAHSGHLQKVQWKPQSPSLALPENGCLFEVCVPFTRSYRKPDPTSDPLYRLYYQSVAWVEGIEKGEDDHWWYRLLDDLLKVNYYVRSEHLRRVVPEELTPISPEIPLGGKRILVSLAQQEVLAFENERLVMRTRISSGIPDYRPRTNGIPTVTPTGRFYITQKTPLRHMGDGRLTDSLEAYELPGVPWVSFFHETGVAFHGTYWHNDFGRPKSHGCINMHTDEAKWLFRWTLPTIEADTMLKAGHGTSVLVV